MARESQNAAMVAEQNGFIRSSVSRYYYAAFQASTAILHYLKLTPPEGEEGWSHAQTPDLLRQHLEPIVRSKDVRRKIATSLGELYKLRLEADYVGAARWDRDKLKQAGSRSRYLVKFAESILPGG